MLVIDTVARHPADMHSTKGGYRLLYRYHDVKFDEIITIMSVFHGLSAVFLGLLLCRCLQR